MPYFSIIIPTFNRAHSINRALKSVLDQSFQDIEVIVIDDASTDNTKEVVGQMKDKRIHYVLNDVNFERCVSRNKGIEKAKGKYICFLDSDDYHLPYHLEELYYLIQSKEEPVGFFFANAWNETVDGLRTERGCPDFEITDPYSYFLHYTVNPQRWCVHRQIFEKIQFDPKVTICEDMDTSLRIVNAGFPVFQLKKRTTVYVAAKDSFTHGDPQKWEKELFFLKRIFSKKELKRKLPSTEKKRLLSMCYFHLSCKQLGIGNRIKTIQYSIQSFLYYPKGYNGKTNKILLVNLFYSIFKK